MKNAFALHGSNLGQKRFVLLPRRPDIVRMVVSDMLLVGAGRCFSRRYCGSDCPVERVAPSASCGQVLNRP